MKKALYQVKTETGNTYFWQFIEQHNENDYGNGNYISIVVNDDLLSYVDMRYQKYAFETFCEKYIKDYYGDNLWKYKFL